MVPFSTLNILMDCVIHKGLDIPSLEISSPCLIPLLKSDQSYAFPILNILVPQVGHIPCVAGLPFFMVIDLASFISFLALHLRQYACISNLHFYQKIDYSLPKCQSLIIMVLFAFG